MKKISDDKVFSLHPLPDGFIYSYMVGINGDKVKVGYKTVAFEHTKISKVTKSIFMLSKFGAGYKSFAEKIKNYITCYAFPFEDGRTLVIETDGSAVIYGLGGQEIWTGDFLYCQCPPSGAAVNGNTLWLTYKEQNTIIKYDLAAQRQELRIGGPNSPFAGPTGLFPAGSKLFICCKENKNIWKLDCSNYQTELYIELEDKVVDYKFINNSEIAVLDSGIYFI